MYDALCVLIFAYNSFLSALNNVWFGEARWVDHREFLRYEVVETSRPWRVQRRQLHGTFRPSSTQGVR